MDQPIKIRPARDDDRGFIDAFAYAEGMDRIPSLDNVDVAVDPDDDPIAFLRIAFGGSGDAYINPVVVNEVWRGRGVGEMLVQKALADHGKLKLVSRGASIGFYRALGFEECAWDDIEENVSEDCAHCSWVEECGPLPMIKTTGRA